MQFYFLLILASISLFFLWFGYYSNKKIYIIFACVLGMILGVLIMANGITVPDHTNINGTVDKNAFVKFLLPTGNANQLLTTDGNNIYWTDQNTDINLIATNYWTKSGTDLIYTGDVRIGDVASTHPFAVTNSTFDKPLFEVRDNGYLYFGGGGNPKRIIAGPSWAGDNVYIGFYENSGFNFKAYQNTHTSTFNHNLVVGGDLTANGNFIFGGDLQMASGKRIYSGYQNSLYMYGGVVGSTNFGSGVGLILGHTGGTSNLYICNNAGTCHTRISADGRSSFGATQDISGTDGYRMRIKPYSDGNTNIDLWSFNKYINNNTYISGLGFYGWDPGYKYEGFGAKIETYGAGKWSNTSRPTYMAFKLNGTGEIDVPEKARLTQDGNLGIGTTTPLQKLDVNGNIHVKDLEGTYTGGSAYVCVYDSGVLYASESACP